MWGEIGNSENLTGLVAVSLIFGMPIIIVVAALIYKAHKATLLRETIEHMIDKGQPVPPEWLQGRERAAAQRSPLHRGILLVAIGAGLLIMFLTGPQGLERLWGVATIPLLLGVAYLLIWAIDRRTERSAGRE